MCIRAPVWRRLLATQAALTHLSIMHDDLPLGMIHVPGRARSALLWIAGWLSSNTQSWRVSAGRSAGNPSHTWRQWASFTYKALVVVLDQRCQAAKASSSWSLHEAPNGQR